MTPMQGWSTTGTYMPTGGSEMRRRIFADTSALYELVDENTLHHREVAEFLRENARSIRLVITDYIFDEVLTLVMTKLGKHHAIVLGEKLRSSEFCSMVKVESEDVEAAWEVFRRYKDKEWSFTDCTSYVVMKRLDIREALATDDHFRQMGLSVLPGL
ncbi:MAG: VapC toxin family PIN domain ribonuclease [Thermoproteota archaeon]|nr:MAG: VapC toxin family PIN domain ribonuclease [Candidatus Korarchaeota archaeon]